MIDPTSRPTPRTIRRLGWLMLVVGLFLFGLMGMITWRMYPSMSHPGVPDAGGSTFTGTPEMARNSLQLFAGATAFGAVSAVNGMWQIVTGRRNLVFVAITLVLGAALFLAARGMGPSGG